MPYTDTSNTRPLREFSSVETVNLGGYGHIEDNVPSAHKSILSVPME